MMTFYYWPGACSMAVHVVLEEIGAPYQSWPVDLTKDEQHGAPFRHINPRGQVPVLTVDGRTIQESVAILSFLGRRFPDAQLLPENSVDEARCMAMMSWISSSVDPLFRRAGRPERFVEGEEARIALKEGSKAAYWTKCQEIDGLLDGKPWIMGTQYSVCDPYLAVYYGWGQRLGLPMPELAAYTGMKERILERPAVRRVLVREQHPLLKVA